MIISRLLETVHDLIWHIKPGSSSGPKSRADSNIKQGFKPGSSPGHKYSTESNIKQGFKPGSSPGPKYSTK